MTHWHALRAGGSREFGGWAPDARAFLREPLPPAQCEALARWLRANPESTLRLQGRATEMVECLQTALPRSLELLGDGVAPARGRFERVERVAFDGVAGWRDWLQRLPNARIVRVLLHGRTVSAADVARAGVTALSLAEGSVVDLAALRGAPGLRVLEFRDVELDRVDAIGTLAELRSLRLCAVDRLSSIEALRGHRQLRSLWLERLPFLRRLNVLPSLPSLESLDVASLWQFDLRDARAFFALPALRRAGIDIGGKRKNVEILKRLALPPPPPYSFEREVAGVTI